MSGDLMILFELSLVFLVVFGWGWNELRQLNKYKREQSRRSASKDATNELSDSEASKTRLPERCD